MEGRMGNWKESMLLELDYFDVSITTWLCDLEQDLISLSLSFHTYKMEIPPSTS